MSEGIFGPRFEVEALHLCELVRWEGVELAIEDTAGGVLVLLVSIVDAALLRSDFECLPVTLQNQCAGIVVLAEENNSLVVDNDCVPVVPAFPVVPGNLQILPGWSFGREVQHAERRL